jgi:hypothetical protein
MNGTKQQNGFRPSTEQTARRVAWGKRTNAAKKSIGSSLNVGKRLNFAGFMTA